MVNCATLLICLLSMPAYLRRLTRILDSLKCLQMSQILKESLAKNAKAFLGDLGVFAYMDVGEGREQDAEALREKMFFSCLVSLRPDLTSACK